MHEASIVEYAMQAVRLAALRNHIHQIQEITLEIGKMRVAIPDILQYSFHLYQKESMFEHAVLTIHEKDIIIHCNECGRDFDISAPTVTVCPHCKSPKIQIMQGNELSIESFRGY